MGRADSTNNRFWNSITRDILKSEMSASRTSHEDLAGLLENIGVRETKASIENKKSRGSFSAKFLIQSLVAIDSPMIRKYSESIKSELTGYDEVVAEEKSMYGNNNVSWDREEGFYRNSFSEEWFVDAEQSSAKLIDNKVVSLFSGAGGLDIGLEEAGYETVACVENNADCKATLRRNRPSWNIVEGSENGDIRSVSTSDILRSSGLVKGEAALVVGGAPCQPFSNIGKKGGVADKKNGGDLFQEFVRIVDGVYPQGFIFENVVGITQQKHSEVLTYMKSCLSGLGYSLAYKILNAANYGVPQKRERFFLIGLRNQRVPAFPLQTHFKNTQQYSELCFQLGLKKSKRMKSWVGVGKAFRSLNESHLNRSDNVVMNISDVVKNRMELIGPGENFHVLPMEMRPNCWRSGKHQGQDTFGRLKMEEPSATIRTAAYNPSKGRYIHPVENRGLSSFELACLQGFPKSWRFASSKYDRVTLTSAGRQIGNAVPPPLAEAIGKALYVQLCSGGQKAIAKSA